MDYIKIIKKGKNKLKKITSEVLYVIKVNRTIFI